MTTGNVYQDSMYDIPVEYPLSGGVPYVLPVASATVLGGVRIGDHLTMSSDVLSADNQFAGAEIPFSWGDATPEVLASVSANTLIRSISMLISVPFDGAFPSLSIGVTGSPELLMATFENDPKSPGTYIVYPGYTFLSPDIIKLFITPGAGPSTGSGVITIEY
jgi:hypothetical protein